MHYFMYIPCCALPVVICDVIVLALYDVKQIASLEAKLEELRTEHERVLAHREVVEKGYRGHAIDLMDKDASEIESNIENARASPGQTNKIFMRIHEAHKAVMLTAKQIEHIVQQLAEMQAPTRQKNTACSLLCSQPEYHMIPVPTRTKPWKVDFS